eukprot:1319905-Amphidinium_carterae.1
MDNSEGGRAGHTDIGLVSQASEAFEKVLGHSSVRSYLKCSLRVFPTAWSLCGDKKQTDIDPRSFCQWAPWPHSAMADLRVGGRFRIGRKIGLLALHELRAAAANATVTGEC